MCVVVVAMRALTLALTFRRSPVQIRPQLARDAHGIRRNSLGVCEVPLPMVARTSQVALCICAGLAALVVNGCADGTAGQQALPSATASSTPSDRERAARLDVATEPLPSRAEVVALTDRLAIAASEYGNASGKASESAELAFLAAKLRERLWRHDGVVTDAREAGELYLAVLDTAPGTAISCEADLRRALLAGELVRDGAASYRELYLAHQRHRMSPSRTECASRIAVRLETARAFRPEGAAWVALEEHGRVEAASFAAAIAAAEAANDGVAASSASAPASGGSIAAAGAKPASAAGQGTGAPALPSASAIGGLDVVVRPDASAVKDSAELTKLEPYSWPGGGRLVLSLSAPIRFDVGTVAPDAAAQRGHRLYLDLEGAVAKGVKPELTTAGLVSGIRLGARGKGVRVVIDLVEAAFHRVFYLPDPFRVVVDLSPRVATTATAPGRSGTRVVRRVALDPGHGGADSGALGPTGLMEKDVVLDVAHRAAPALAHELGVETMLTRDSDAYVPLEERTARANAFHADLFISIHCNATEDGNAKGLEVYILDPTREMDALSRRSVMRENHLSSERGKFLDPSALDAQIASIASGLNLGATTDGSRLFAQLLRRSAVASLAQRYGEPNDHGVKTAAFFVLLGAEMPATLFETAFISNPADEARLGTADFRQKLADSIVNAVRAYREGVK
ncbi:MAG: N-acetylmuramoyl-L-alanine amidase [Myxococcales bacterium]|nr:N-acetylmuramoyl-L-alanine amidase [Myxococcales bacterium]